MSKSKGSNVCSGLVMGILAWHADISYAWILAVITQWQLPTSPTSKMKS